MTLNKFSKIILSLTFLLFASSLMFAQGINLNDPNTIFKDKSGYVFTQDSLLSFVKKGSFSMAHGPTENGKKIVTLFRKTDADKKADSLRSASILEKNSALINTSLPAFNLKTLSKKRINATKLQGKITVVNFWFTACAPCVKEIPELNKLIAKYDVVNFIAITHNNNAELKKFLKLQPFKFTHIPNAKDYITQTGVSSFPTTMIIDENGIIKSIVTGGRADIFDVISKEIDKLTAKPN